MSFGFKDPSQVIRKAVKYAYDNDVLLLAAAGNSGGLEAVRYPARDPHVLCVHAATGYGNMYNGNPTIKANTSNFALLGVAVPGNAPAGREQTEIRRSGTSQATAMGAAVAAIILQIMRDRQEEAEEAVGSIVYRQALSQLRRLHSMRSVFERMCDTNKRDGYDIVEPWRLLNRYVTESNVASQACLDIIKCLDIQLVDDHDS